MHEALAALRSDAGKVLVEDELKFMDRESMTFYAGVECHTEFD